MYNLTVLFSLSLFQSTSTAHRRLSSSFCHVVSRSNQKNLKTVVTNSFHPQQSQQQTSVGFNRAGLTASPSSRAAAAAVAAAAAANGVQAAGSGIQATVVSTQDQSSSDQANFQAFSGLQVNNGKRQLWLGKTQQEFPLVLSDFAIKWELLFSYRNTVQPLEKATVYIYRFC